MKPTSEQEKAIKTEGRALIVEAGAGTGKTWVLVERFLQLLSQHPDWPLESIVAITFTKKATREMRTRIRQAVEKRAAADTRAASLWARRLSELENLQVSTIHGLCSQILRENAIAAGIDPRFTVLEELDAGLLKEEAIRQTLAALAKVDDPSLALLAALNVGDLHQELERLLEKQGTVQEQFEHLPGIDQLLERWTHGMNEMRSSMWTNRLKAEPDLSRAIEELPYVTIIDPADALSRAVILAQEGCVLLDQGNLVGAFASWSQIRRVGGRSANWGGVEVLRDLKLLLGELQNTEKALSKAGATGEIGEEDEKAAEWLQLWRQIWNSLIDRYDRLKEEREGLDFDDLEIHAERLLKKRPISGRLQDYLAGINHLMVDEFQDTNTRQKNIVYALADPQEGGRLFVVGDAKQSIYRFRQAQVAVFNRTANDIEDITGHKPLPLSRSFRTHMGLLDTLNNLFEQILSPIGTAYADYEARPGSLNAHRPAPPADSSAPAPVELLLIPNKDEDDKTISAEEARRAEARWLSQRFFDLKNSRFLVWKVKDQVYGPFRYGDAAILFRATTNLPLYEEEFKSVGLPYLTVGGRGYYDRPEVRDLLALLHCLYDRRDNLNLAAALRSPMFNFSDETLYRLRWRTAEDGRSESPIMLADALNQPPPNGQTEVVAFAKIVMNELWDLAGRTEVWQLLRSALDLTGYEAALILSDKDAAGGSRQYNNVRKFLAQARERGDAALSDFLRRIQDLQLREAREGEAPGGEPDEGAVQLMSIHAAKGLEFPVVVVADLGRRLGGRTGSPRILHDPAYGLVCMGRNEDGDWTKPASFNWAAWMDDQMDEAERRRLFYVACTRAADLLILSGKLGSRNSWLQRVLALWDIDGDGEEEQLISEPDCSVRVLRMDAQDVEGEKRFTPDTDTASGADETSGAADDETPETVPHIPALAAEVPMSVEREPVSVSRMARILAKESGIYPEIRPVVNLEKQQERPSNYLVGRVVHRALADWSCLSLSEPQLMKKLERYASESGAADDIAGEAARKARRMMANLQGKDLYDAINRAQTQSLRYSEVPFTLETKPVSLYGIVDLLYRDKNDVWYLVDWKTEWLPRYRSNDDAGREHRYQIAAYAVAMEKTLGRRPEVSLCFLNPNFRQILIPASDVNRAWQEIIEDEVGHGNI